MRTHIWKINSLYIKTLLVAHHSAIATIDLIRRDVNEKVNTSLMRCIDKYVCTVGVNTGEI